MSAKRRLTKRFALYWCTTPDGDLEERPERQGLHARRLAKRRPAHRLRRHHRETAARWPPQHDGGRLQGRAFEGARLPRGRRRDEFRPYEGREGGVPLRVQGRQRRLVIRRISAVRARSNIRGGCDGVRGSARAGPPGPRCTAHRTTNAKSWATLSLGGYFSSSTLRCTIETTIRIISARGLDPKERRRLEDE